MKSMKNRNLKGSVLLAVVSVMSLLIIFMGTTLVLAAAANSRAHRSYTTSQAEYTARAALDSFTTAMEGNRQIAGAVKNLSESTEIKLDLGTDAVGKIGYYDDKGNFKEGYMLISPVPDKSVWVFGEDDTSGKPHWFEVSTYKLTTTAKVGKDERTVSLYFRQMPTSKTDGKKIKGIQSVGKVDALGDVTGRYTGAIVVGVGDDGDKKYDGNAADTTWEDCLAFINGNLTCKTGNGMDIRVKSSNSQTVVLGDIDCQNGKLVNFDDSYKMSASYTQQDIPYLFIEGCLKGSSTTLSIGGKGANHDRSDKETPYNLFVGQINVPQGAISADVYIMDAGKDNVIGGNDTHLYNFVSSTFNNDPTFKAVGGSVFCNGNLTLKNAKIDGDVRVVGNLTVEGNTTIGGDLVVGGETDFKNKPTVTGNIYSNSGPVLKDGVDTKELNSRKVENGDNFDNLTEEEKENIEYGFFNNTGDQHLCYGRANGEGEKLTVYTTNSGNNIIKESEAFEKSSELPEDFTIYPERMTKEKIYGTLVNKELKPASDTTKIIKTLSEVREDLGMEADGSYDETRYPKTIVDADFDPVDGAGDKVLEITKPTRLTGTFDKTEIKIKATTDMWVEFDNVTFMNGAHIILDGSSTGTIKFFVKGKLSMNADGCYVLPDYVADNSVPYIYEVTPDSVNAVKCVWYGAENSVVESANNITLYGSFRAPEMQLKLKCSEGKYQIKYVAEGKTAADAEVINPSIIGNALVANAELSNNVKMINSDAGDSTKSGIMKTEVGYFEYGYFAEY